MTPFNLICLSHLMWEETLFQRPQHLMSRLAGRGAFVYYQASIGTRRWMRLRREGTPPLAGTVVEGRLHFRTLPYIPGAYRLPFVQRADQAFQAWMARRALRNRFRLNESERANMPMSPRLERNGCCPCPTVLWLYHPDMIDVAGRVPHDLLVYDVMDQFAAFDGSRPGVAEREARLLAEADIVFTGGRTLHADKVGRRPDAICFPSGVDVDHFAQALAPETPMPPEVEALPKPRLIYIGAVDERIDFDLVEGVCRARPHWSYLFVGPLVGMERPPVAAPNFHYLGPKPYSRLPEYLKAADVATMPWRRSPLTAHISPTKTPEYLAAGRPVVSVPIPDVERDYGDTVSLADGAEAFASACDDLIGHPPPDLSERLRARARAASWEAIAEAMERRIREALNV